MKTPRKYESAVRREQAEATRSRIMEALSALIVEEHPSVISVPEVARRAGVSVRSVYHHFPTKESLFEGLSPWINAQLGVDGALPEISSAAEIAALVPSVVELLQQHRELFDALRASGHDDPERRRARLGERRAWIADALAGTTADLPPRDERKLTALLAHLMSFEVHERLTLSGLDEDEAVEAMQWAIVTLADRARRTGRASIPTSPRGAAASGTNTNGARRSHDAAAPEKGANDGKHRG